MIPFRAVLASSLLVLPLLAAAPSGAGELGRSRLCPEDAPPGVHLPDRPECGHGGAGAPAREPAARGHAGFIDLGNGTSVRLSGRARADYDLRR